MSTPVNDMEASLSRHMDAIETRLDGLEARIDAISSLVDAIEDDRCECSGCREQRGWPPREHEEIFEVEDIVCVRATGAALLCEGLRGEQFWIPVSQLDARSDVQTAGDMGSLIISEWLARQKGWV